MYKLNIVLVEPQIPQNTGNISRTCAVTGAVLHLIKPYGFEISDKHLKRAGLDYWNKLKIFEYENLPETINKRDLETLLQMNGFACGCLHNGKPYILQASYAGILNEQFLPTKMIVVNPYLNMSEEFTIGKDCIWFRNDSNWQGLLPLAKKYSYLLAEVDISFRFSAINSRILNLIVADNDRTKESAEKVLKDVFEGKKTGIIMSNALMESLKTYPYGDNTNGYIKQLIELRQYLWANWFIDLGLNANYNMKRESLSANEVVVNEETLLPFIDDMYKERVNAIEAFNTMFNTDIKVKYSSAWKEVNELSTISAEQLQANLDQTKSETEQLDQTTENLSQNAKESDLNANEEGDEQ